MTWPTVNVDTTDTDADTDSPLAARVDILDLMQKFNQIRAHVSTYMQTVLDDLDSAAARATLAAAGTGVANTYLEPQTVSKQIISGTLLTANKPSGSAVFTDVYGALLILDSRFAAADAVGMQCQASGVHNFWGIKKGGSSHVLAVNLTGTPVDAIAVTSAGFVTLGAGLNVVGVLTDDGVAVLNETSTNTVSNKTYAAPIVTGLLDISDPSAGQLKFPATENTSADPNTLTDFEKGTWIPSVGGTATYTTQTGKYTKIGNAVVISGTIVINVIGTGSTTTISGLPFTSGTLGSVVTIRALTAATAIVSIVGTIGAAGTNISLDSRTAASASDSSNAIFQASAQVISTGSYFV